MLLDMGLFSILAMRYKYVNNGKKETEELQLEETNARESRREGEN